MTHDVRLLELGDLIENFVDHLCDPRPFPCRRWYYNAYVTEELPLMHENGSQPILVQHEHLVVVMKER